MEPRPKICSGCWVEGFCGCSKVEENPAKKPRLEAIKSVLEK
jgi:hypothetical protein